MWLSPFYFGEFIFDSEMNQMGQEVESALDCKCCLFVWLFVVQQFCFLSADIERDSNWQRREPVAALGAPKHQPVSILLILIWPNTSLVLMM